MPIVRKTDRKGRLTLPGDFADRLVTLERIGEDEIRVRKTRELPKRYSLKELVAGITDANRHPEVKTGPAVGREAW
jgi:hypothetical protein